VYFAPDSPADRGGAGVGTLARSFSRECLKKKRAFFRFYGAAGKVQIPLGWMGVPGASACALILKKMLRQFRTLSIDYKRNSPSGQKWSKITKTLMP
jgi:hypothetical protein